MAKKRGTSQAQSSTVQKQLDAKLLAYCAMAGGALLAAPPAEAAVVYSGVKNLALPTFNGKAVDLDNDGKADMRFVPHNLLYMGVQSIGLSCMQDNSFVGNNVGPSNILFGSSIVPALPWRQGKGILNAFYASSPTYISPPWGAFANTTGYIGMKFSSGGARHYGWIQYRGSVGSYYGYPISTGTIIDWAYESTPETPIKAGQTTDPTTTTTTTTTTQPTTTSTTTTVVFTYTVSNNVTIHSFI